MKALPRLRVHRPADRDELFGLLSEGVLPLAGGTELLLAAREGLLPAAEFVDVKASVGFGDRATTCTVSADSVQLGALLTHSDVVRHCRGLGADRELFVALGPVVNSIGNIRVRNQGTLGGNLAFGEPRSDWITSLVALDATVALVSPSGVRTASLAELLVDAFQVDRAPAELIETVDVKTSDLRAFAYRRVCRGERPLANVACASRGDAGAIKEIVLAVGACTAVPSVTRLSLSELDGVNANDLATGLELFDVRRGAEVAVRSAVVALLRDVLAELKALK